MKYEGQTALESSFRMLGEVAMRELFSNPKVETGLAELDKHWDEEEVKRLLSTAENADENG